MEVAQKPYICQYYFKPKEECMKATAILQSQGFTMYHVRMDGKRKTCMGDLSQCYFKASSRPHPRPYTQPGTTPSSVIEDVKEPTTATGILIMMLAMIDKKYSSGTVFDKLKGEEEKSEFVNYVLEYGEFKFCNPETEV